MSDRRLSTWILAAVAVATVAPLFAVDLLPFTDLPEHLAVMASLRHWFDPLWRVQEHYVLALGQSQYLLYHLLGAVLSAVTGSAESANLVLLAAVGIAFPFSLRSLLRATGRDERLALFGCPLFWNRALVCGFLPYVASVPVLLFIIAYAVREAEAPRTSRAVVLTLSAMSLFYLHASAFILLTVIAPATALTSLIAGSGKEPSETSLLEVARRLPRRLLWLAPSVVCAAAWTVVGKVTLRGESLADDGEIGRMNALRSVHAFTLWAHDVWWSHIDEWCAVAYWGLFLVLLLGRLRAGKSDRTVRLMDPAYVPFLVTAAMYFALPFRIGAGVMLNVRLAPILAMFAVLGLPAVRLAWDRWVLGCVAAVSLVVAFDAAYEMRAIVREDVAGIDDLLARTTMGKRLVLLSFKLNSSRSHFPPWVHVGAYHRARKGGVASFSFTELRHWPIHYAPGAAPPVKSEAFWDFQPCLYRNAEDGAYYDYVLVRGEIDPFRDAPPGPAFKSIGTVKDFTLFEKVPEKTNPAWRVADQGPCRARDDVEKDHPQSP